jgi:hypothetical protein
MTACGHCGLDPAAGYATGPDGTRLCHPDDPRLPDCYRRVTVWHEPLGRLRGTEPKPPGIEGRFTCPQCGRTSHNLADEMHGYCAACHQFTGAVA